MRKQKVAILTLYVSTFGNYGQVLQGYSTYTFLRENGYEPVILNFIDYTYSPECKVMHKIDNVFLRRVFFKIRNFVYDLKYPRNIYLARFIRKKVKMTEPCFSKDQILKELEEYNTFICGSDTCWYAGSAIDCFSLAAFKRNESNKIAFAVSTLRPFLNKDTQAFWNAYKKGIQGLTAISTRELETSNIIKELTGRDATQVLDPVFLISKQNWMRFASKRLERERYIFVYLMGESRIHENFIYKIRQKYRGRKILLTRKMGNYNVTIPKSEIKDKLSVEQWISLIEHADVVVTDSYHGVAFSLIFNKPFYALMRDNDNKLFNRVENILRACELMNRVGDDNTDMSNEIDYDLVNKRLEKLQKVSKEFLMQALNSSVS